MPVSETVQYIVLFAITVIFSVFALTLDTYRLILKILAGFCWFILALLQFIVGDITSGFTMGIAFFFMGIGIIFLFSTIQEFFEQRKKGFYDKDSRKMGKF